MNVCVCLCLCVCVCLSICLSVCLSVCLVIGHTLLSCSVSNTHNTLSTAVLLLWRGAGVVGLGLFRFYDRFLGRCRSAGGPAPYLLSLCLPQQLLPEGELVPMVEGRDQPVDTVVTVAPPGEGEGEGKGVGDQKGDQVMVFHHPGRRSEKQL